MLAAKEKDSQLIAGVEIITAFLVLAVLLFNLIKTKKMGKQYDELNLSASDYTLYIDIAAKHRSEFMEKFREKIEG